jgi:hypothetical protein
VLGTSERRGEREHDGGLVVSLRLLSNQSLGERLDTLQTVAHELFGDGVTFEASTEQPYFRAGEEPPEKTIAIKVVVELKQPFPALVTNQVRGGAAPGAPPVSDAGAPPVSEGAIPRSQLVAGATHTPVSRLPSSELGDPPVSGRSVESGTDEAAGGPSFFSPWSSAQRAAARLVLQAGQVVDLDAACAVMQQFAGQFGRSAFSPERVARSRREIAAGQYVTLEQWQAVTVAEREFLEASEAFMDVNGHAPVELGRMRDKLTTLRAAREASKGTMPEEQETVGSHAADMQGASGPTLSLAADEAKAETSKDVPRSGPSRGITGHQSAAPCTSSSAAPRAWFAYRREVVEVVQKCAAMPVSNVVAAIERIPFHASPPPSPRVEAQRPGTEQLPLTDALGRAVAVPHPDGPIYHFQTTDEPLSYVETRELERLRAVEAEHLKLLAELQARAIKFGVPAECFGELASVPAPAPSGEPSRDGLAQRLFHASPDADKHIWNRTHEDYQERWGKVADAAISAYQPVLAKLRADLEAWGKQGVEYQVRYQQAARHLAEAERELGDVAIKHSALKAKLEECERERMHWSLELMRAWENTAGENGTRTWRADAKIAADQIAEAFDALHAKNVELADGNRKLQQMVNEATTREQNALRARPAPDCAAVEACAKEVNDYVHDDVRPVLAPQWKQQGYWPGSTRIEEIITKHLPHFGAAATGGVTEAMRKVIGHDWKGDGSRSSWQADEPRAATFWYQTEQEAFAAHSAIERARRDLAGLSIPIGLGTAPAEGKQS